MRKKAQQLALGTALGCPLIITIVLAGGSTAATSAQPGMRMLGPRFPPLLDVSGSGPMPGQPTLNPQPAGAATLNLTSRWQCTSLPGNQVGLTSQDSSGKYRTARQQNHFREQSLTISGFTGGAPTQFSYTALDRTGIRSQGTGTLVDTNGDGLMDTIVTTGKINANVNLVFSSDGNYVSIPASQAALFGAGSSACGGPVGQIWVPLADTTGRGRGDTIIFDLDGDGIADPQFYTSAKLGATSVPTASNFALSLLTALLTGIGVWYIGRRQLSGPGPLSNG